MADRSMFGDVVVWHQMVGHPVATEVNIAPSDSLALGWRLVDEELRELQDGYAEGDAEEVADGIVDLVWVLFGLAARMGINVDAVWAEVKRANFAKLTGPKRADGKQLKPAGWKPPDVAAALAKPIERRMGEGLVMPRKDPGIETLIAAGLRALGYDGLYCPDIECGCHLSDLMPCGDVQPDCKAGINRPLKAKAADTDYWIESGEPTPPPIKIQDLRANRLDPIRVTCARCGAKKGERCRRPSGAPCHYHQIRVAEATAHELGQWVKGFGRG